jgi:hypothetical protein
VHAILSPTSLSAQATNPSDRYRASRTGGPKRKPDDARDLHSPCSTGRFKAKADSDNHIVPDQVYSYSSSRVFSVSHQRSSSSYLYRQTAMASSQPRMRSISCGQSLLPRLASHIIHLQAAVLGRRSSRLAAAVHRESQRCVLVSCTAAKRCGPSPAQERPWKL